MGAPALARNGVHTFGMAEFPSSFAMHTARPFMRNGIVTPHIVSRNADLRNDLRFRRHALLQNDLPITIWPYSSLADTTPMDVLPAQSEVPLSPPVIAMSGLPNGVPDRTVTRNSAGLRLHCRMPSNSQWLPL